MNKDIQVNWNQVENDLTTLDEYQREILTDMTKFSNFMDESTRGMVGKKADELRKSIVEYIGANEFEADGTLKAVYREIRDLNFELKTTLQQIANISNTTLKISDDTFDYDNPNAWNFSWQSNSDEVKLFNREELRNSLNKMSDIIDDIEWIVFSYLGVLERLIYNEYFTTELDDFIIQKGKQFSTIVSNIKAKIAVAIVDINIYIDELEQAVQQLGQNITNN